MTKHNYTGTERISLDEECYQMKDVAFISLRELLTYKYKGKLLYSKTFYGINE